MKKILLLCILTTFAGASGRGIWDVKSVTLSSTTATEIFNVEERRKGFEIKNVTGGSYEIYIATYAATSSANLFTLTQKGNEGSILKDYDGDNCYTGAIYGLGAAGISTSTVVAIEKR